MKVAGRVFRDANAGTLLAKQLTYQNANTACQAARRPYKHIGTITDYITLHPILRYRTPWVSVLFCFVFARMYSLLFCYNVKIPSPRHLNERRVHVGLGHIRTKAKQQIE